jgi:hypothetical protein
VVPPLALGGDAGVAANGHVPRSPHQVGLDAASVYAPSLSLPSSPLTVLDQ